MPIKRMGKRTDLRKSFGMGENMFLKMLLSVVLGHFFCQVVKADTPVYDLPAPSKSSSIALGINVPGDMSLYEDTIAILERKGKRVFTFPVERFSEIAAAFEGWTSFKQYELPFKAKIWGGLGIDNGSFFVFDRKLRSTKVFRVEDKFSQESDVVIDGIKPPADTRGEPTWQEASTLRGRFVKEMLKYKRNNLAGVARISSELIRNSREVVHSEETSHFLGLLNIEGFSVVRMSCSGYLSSLCKIERACYLGELSKNENEEFSGIAFENKKRGLLAIGLHDARKLAVLKFNSCYSVQLQYYLNLPETIGGVRSLALDEKSNLYVLDRTVSPYYNKILYRFGPSDWKR